MTTPVYIIGLCLLCIAVLVTIIVKLSRKLTLISMKAEHYMVCAEFAVDTIDHMMSKHWVSSNLVNSAMTAVKKRLKAYDTIDIIVGREGEDRSKPVQTRVCKRCGCEYPITDYEEVDGYRRRVCKHCRNEEKVERRNKKN